MVLGGISKMKLDKIHLANFDETYEDRVFTLPISEPDFLGFANPYAVQTLLEWKKGSKCHMKIT